MADKVVTRFAPSPTGYMHVGGVRTALFAWAFARKMGGTFILRFEDTDKKREVSGSKEHIIEALSWLGLKWDEGPDIGGPHAPYEQSQRLDTYIKYARILHDKGLAYADPYSPEEIEDFKKQAETEKRPFLFRRHRPDHFEKWDGSKPLRFKVPVIKSYEWHDLVRGDLKAGEEALDDIILIKSDGYPTYNFAHIIDDLLMNVTHIFRADEFISSTPNYLALYEALEIKRPEFVTLPPILGPDGKKKLGKRDNAKDILAYRDEGYLPEAMINFLAFIGWNPGDERELIAPDEFVTEFSIERIHQSGGRLNEEKLDWINKEYIKKLPVGEIEKEIEKVLPEKHKGSNMIKRIVPVVRERIVKFGDIKTMWHGGELSYFFEPPVFAKSDLICPPKLRKNADVKTEDVDEFLRTAEKTLENIPENVLTEQTVKDALWDIATGKGRGVTLWAMRFALSGKERSPDPFTLAAVLGRDEAVKRLRYAQNL